MIERFGARAQDGTYYLSIWGASNPSKLYFDVVGVPTASCGTTVSATSWPGFPATALEPKKAPPRRPPPAPEPGVDPFTVNEGAMPAESSGNLGEASPNVMPARARPRSLSSPRPSGTVSGSYSVATLIVGFWAKPQSSRGGGLVPVVGRAALADESVHHRDDGRRPLRSAAPTNVLRRIGVAGLAADRPGVADEQLILVDDRLSPVSVGNIAVGCAVIWANTGLAIAARKITARSWRRPAWTTRAVEARRGGGVGVGGADGRGLGVHLVHRDVVAAEHVGQRVGGVVARYQQGGIEQLARGAGCGRA